MDIRRGFARSLKLTRKAKGFAQEDLSDVSGRTYIGEVERGQKAPTLQKIDKLARAMEVHPLTLLAIAYLPSLREHELETLQTRVNAEARKILGMTDKLRPRKARPRSR